MLGPSALVTVVFSLATGSRSVDHLLTFSVELERHCCCCVCDGLACLLEFFVVVCVRRGRSHGCRAGCRFPVPTVDPPCLPSGYGLPCPLSVLRTCQKFSLELIDPRPLDCLSLVVLLDGQTELTVTFLSEAVRVLTSGCRERSQALQGSANGASGGGGGGGDVAGVEGVLRELQSTLAEEMALSLSVLRQEEEKAAAAAGAASVSCASRM